VARRYEALSKEITELDAHLDQLVEQVAPELVSLPSWGASSSGTLAARAALAWVSCAMIMFARRRASLSSSKIERRYWTCSRRSSTRGPPST
jgi:hypothetical protein